MYAVYVTNQLVHTGLAPEDRLEALSNRTTTHARNPRPSHLRPAKSVRRRA